MTKSKDEVCEGCPSREYEEKRRTADRKAYYQTGVVLFVGGVLLAVASIGLFGPEELPRSNEVEIKKLQNEVKSLKKWRDKK